MQASVQDANRSGPGRVELLALIRSMQHRSRLCYLQSTLQATAKYSLEVFALIGATSSRFLLVTVLLHQVYNPYTVTELVLMLWRPILVL